MFDHNILENHINIYTYSDRYSPEQQMKFHLKPPTQALLLLYCKHSWTQTGNQKN